MRATPGDNLKRRTVKRKTALVVRIIQGRTTVAEVSRAFGLLLSEIEDWVDHARRGMKNGCIADGREAMAPTIRGCTCLHRSVSASRPRKATRRRCRSRYS